MNEEKEYIIRISGKHLVMVFAGLNELPGKYCNPVFGVIEPQIIEQDKEPDKEPPTEE